MALDRFTNKDEILDTNGVVKGIVWKADDQQLLKLDVNKITPTDTPYIELHAYTPTSDYIGGGTTEQFKVKADKLYIDYYAALNDLEITRGLFEVVVNVHRILLGNPDDPEFYIKEISPDRREVAITANLPEGVDKEEQATLIKEYLEKFGRDSYTEIIYDDGGNEIGTEERPSSDDIAINLGGNRIYKIINQKDWGETNEFVIRLYDISKISILPWIRILFTNIFNAKSGSVVFDNISFVILSISEEAYESGLFNISAYFELG